MKPCSCNNVTSDKYTVDQCRLCWLYLHDQAYREHWDQAGLPVSRRTSREPHPSGKPYVDKGCKECHTPLAG